VLKGYMLGDQYTKPLASEAEVGELRNTTVKQVQLSTASPGTSPISPVDGLVTLPVSNSATSSSGTTLATSKAVKTVNDAKLAKTDVVAPSTNAVPGQAADAKATGDALAAIAHDWASGDNYVKYNVVKYDGIYYYAKNDISYSTTPPSTDTTNWGLLSDLVAFFAEFLPLTGGTMTGGITLYEPQNGAYIYFPSKGKARLTFGSGLFIVDDQTGRVTIKGNDVAVLRDIADNFSGSKAYSKDELCIYNYDLYRCINTNGHTGAWADADFAVATVEDVLAALRGKISDIIDGSTVVATAYNADNAGYAGALNGSNEDRRADTIFSQIDSKADAAAIAPEFSTASTYAVGDVVMHEGLRYKCTTAVTTAGDWTGSTNWAEATVEDVLATLRTGKADYWKVESTPATGTTSDVWVCDWSGEVLSYDGVSQVTGNPYWGLFDPELEGGGVHLEYYSTSGEWGVIIYTDQGQKVHEGYDTGDSTSSSLDFGNGYTAHRYASYVRVRVAYLDDIPDVSGKANRASPATAGNLAALTATGDLKDSGYKATDFVEKGATNILIGSGASKVNNVTNAVVIGVNASANGSTTSSAVAIGTEAKAKKTGAIQLGAGENGEEKSLKFRDTVVVGGDGKIPETSLHYVPALESVPTSTIAATAAYVVGDVLGDGGKAYRCKEAYTSAATPKAPSLDTTHWTEVPVLSGKADKPATFTAGNLAALDASGNPTDSGIAKTDLENIEAEISSIPNSIHRIYNSSGTDALDDKGSLYDTTI